MTFLVEGYWFHFLISQMDLVQVQVRVQVRVHFLAPVKVRLLVNFLALVKVQVRVQVRVHFVALDQVMVQAQALDQDVTDWARVLDRAQEIDWVPAQNMGWTLFSYNKLFDKKIRYITYSIVFIGVNYFLVLYNMCMYVLGPKFN